MSLVLLSCEASPKFRILDSEPVDLLNSERLLFINYWAVWCKPCLEEMPVLVEFRRQHPESIEVYALNYDNPTPEQLRKDAAKLDVQLPLLLDDPSAALGVERPDVVPTTLVVREGQVIQILLGPQTMERLEGLLSPE